MGFCHFPFVVLDGHIYADIGKVLVGNVVGDDHFRVECDPFESEFLENLYFDLGTSSYGAGGAGRSKE